MYSWWFLDQICKHVELSDQLSSELYQTLFVVAACAPKQQSVPCLAV